ncbi:MAG: hypothetical protein AB8C46_02710 [Burkholderiaceae bacterium]
MKQTRQSGQALIEYAVVCALVLLALLLAGDDVVVQLIQAIKARAEQFAVLMAAP